jgi:hypothetical protein
MNKKPKVISKLSRPLMSERGYISFRKDFKDPVKGKLQKIFKQNYPTK